MDYLKHLAWINNVLLTILMTELFKKGCKIDLHILLYNNLTNKIKLMGEKQTEGEIERKTELERQRDRETERHRDTETER